MDEFEKALEKKIDRTKGSGDPLTEKFGYIIGRWAREWLRNNNILDFKVYCNESISWLEIYRNDLISQQVHNEKLKSELQDYRDREALMDASKMRCENKALKEGYKLLEERVKLLEANLK